MPRGRKQSISTDDFVPSYRRPDELQRFITSKGKIHNPGRTGLDHSTQRRLAREVKRARYLALLPYVTVLQ